jgi:hypothetical protein
MDGGRREYLYSVGQAGWGWDGWEVSRDEAGGHGDYFLPARQKADAGTQTRIEKKDIGTSISGKR